MTGTPERPETARIVGEARLTMKTLAEDADVPYSTLAQYRTGRTMPKGVRLRVAAALVAHAERLKRLAEDLTEDER